MDVHVVAIHQMIQLLLGQMCFQMVIQMEEQEVFADALEEDKKRILQYNLQSSFFYGKLVGAKYFGRNKNVRNYTRYISRCN